MRAASPSEWAEVAQAVTVQELGPFALLRIDTQPAAMFTINIGTVNGEQRSGPFSMSVRCCFSIVSKPPAAEPTTTPTLVGSSFSMSSFASLTASCAAATANWMKRSMRLACLASTYASGSKSVISPAILQADCSSGATSVTGLIPERPLNRPAQKSSLPVPTDEIVPMPVTTTRSWVMLKKVWGQLQTVYRPLGLRRSRRYYSLRMPVSDVSSDVLDRFTDSRDLFSVFVGNLHP